MVQHMLSVEITMGIDTFSAPLEGRKVFDTVLSGFYPSMNENKEGDDIGILKIKPIPSHLPKRRWCLLKIINED